MASAPISLAAIDTGSNAIRVIIANAQSPQEINVIEAERVPVRLGHHTFTHGELDKKSIERAVGAFSRFRKLFNQHGVERYRAVATSALRNASNREDLLGKIFRQCGIEVEVIDGQEEARLVQKAVSQAFAPDMPPDIIVDLGGGSLEITAKLKDEWHTCSIKIGTVRLLETFGLKGALSADEARMIRRFVASSLAAQVPSSFIGEEATAVACGGNAETLARISSGSEKRILSFKVNALESVLPEILDSDIEERMSEYSVRKDRAEVMGVAAIVFAGVADYLNLKKFLVPKVGIREGVLLDLAEASVGELSQDQEPHTVAMARTFAARLGHNTTHGEQVRRIAATLFSQLKGVHKLSDKFMLPLQLAAMLHDIGEVVNRRSHHKHTEYLISNGRIPGLESPERELVAAIARGHRKSMPSDKYPSFVDLPEKLKTPAKKLAAILRIADSLDSSHRQQIIAVRSDSSSGEITLDVSVAADDNDLPSPEHVKSKAFEELFKKEVVCNITQVSNAKSPGRKSGDRQRTKRIK